MRIDHTQRIETIINPTTAPRTIQTTAIEAIQIAASESFDEKNI